MIIELFDLVSKGKKINIDNNVNISEELLSTSTIRRLNNVHFNGYIDKLIDDTYELVGVVTGTMVIPDDITLEDFEYDFTSEIEENIEETRINYQKSIILLKIYGKIFLWRFLSRRLMKKIKTLNLRVMVGD